MPQPPERGGATHLVALLKRELESFRQFRQILESEQNALLVGDVDALLPLAQRKSEKAAELSQIAEARNKFILDHAGGTNQRGIENWLAAFDPADASGAGKLWRDLIDTAREAKSLNDTNGQVINTRLAANQQALAVITGANTSTANLYGRDGSAYSNIPTSTGRPLGKA